MSGDERDSREQEPSWEVPFSLPERDPALQPERSSLSWRRSLLVLVTGALILTATALRSENYAVVSIGSAIAIATLIPAARSPTGHRQAGMDAAPPLVWIVSLCVALGLLGTTWGVIRLIVD